MTLLLRIVTARSLHRCVGMAVLALLPACLPGRQVTVGETQVGKGLLYQSSNPTYDKFFEETHAVQLSAMGAVDEESKARLPLEHALGTSQSAPEQLAELAKARAQKVGQGGSPLHLTVTGLPREKSDDKPTNVTATLSVSDEAGVAPAERDFVKGLDQTLKSEADLIDKFSPIAAKARQLSTRSSELSSSVDTDFAIASRRSEVSEEVSAAKLILDAVAERSSKISAGAMSFLKIMAEALPPPGPAAPLPAKTETVKTKPKKNGSKPPPAPKPPPASKPKSEPPPSKPKPEPGAESAKPAPAPKPAPPPSKPAEDFNP
jgi:hypothetical protein